MPALYHASSNEEPAGYHGTTKPRHPWKSEGGRHKVNITVTIVVIVTAHILGNEDTVVKNMAIPIKYLLASRSPVVKSAGTQSIVPMDSKAAKIHVSHRSIFRSFFISFVAMLMVVVGRVAGRTPQPAHINDGSAPVIWGQSVLAKDILVDDYFFIGRISDRHFYHLLSGFGFSVRAVLDKKSQLE